MSCPAESQFSSNPVGDGQPGSRLRHCSDKRKAVTDQPFQIHFPAHHEPHRIFLQIDRSAVRPQQGFFVTQIAAGSIVASPCTVCANNKTRPPGRVASMAVRIRPLPPTARMAASAPRPSVSSRTALTRLRARHQSFAQAEAFRYCKPLGIQIGSDYRGPGPFGQNTQNDTDGALSDHQNRFARLQVAVSRSPSCRYSQAPQNRPARTKRRREYGRCPARRSSPSPGRTRQTRRRQARSRPCIHFLVGLALGEGLVAAVIAVAARDVMEDHDAVAGLEIR